MLNCFVGLDFNFNCIKKFFQKIINNVTTIVFIKSLSFEIVLCGNIKFGQVDQPKKSGKKLCFSEQVRENI